MMNLIERLYHDAMAAHLSGISLKEIDLYYWEDEDFCVSVTVELLQGERCVIRNYYGNSNNLQWEANYRKFKQDGIMTGWKEDGTEIFRYQYKDDKFVGKI